MIIASSESTNGDMKNLLDIFINISTPITKDEQLKHIEEYLKDKNLKENLQVQADK